ncbi:MAG: tRNA pseudouridine(55) synthase TruB [Pseudomonadota bacterium]
MSRRRRRAIGPPGLLLVDKPTAVSSATATRAIGRRFGLDPVGHTGTLDPAATGLLVVCTGYGTRLVPWLQEGEKVYTASVRFGAETSTGDGEGEITRSAPVPMDLWESLRVVIPQFTGVITQVPPIFSAIRIGGQRAHALARMGALDDDAVPPREVTIHDLTILGIQGDEVSLQVTCSPGTYIRSLAVDLGRTLGSAAHLSALRRSRTGGFDVADAVPLDTLLEMEAPGPHWRPLPDALPHWQLRPLDGEELALVLNGGPVEDTGGLGEGPVILVDADGSAVAVGEVVEEEPGPRVVVRRMLRDVVRES